MIIADIQFGKLKSEEGVFNALTSGTALFGR